MLPPMLPTRPWPQTLLLTALALLIAAATIMLACGPVAPPIPEEGDAFTAAPQVEGGSEEPEEEPTATPTVEGSGEEPAEEPTATPTTEPEEPTATPTTEPEEPTATPTTEPEEPTATPTTEPEEPTATPTAQYPNLDVALQQIVLGFESGDLTECQAAAQDLVHHGSSVLVEVELSANIDAVDTWMANQGISPRHKDATWAPPHIYAYVPVSLLGALSQQDGVNLIRMSSGIFTDSRAFNERSSCDSDAGGATGASGAGGTSGASGASETSEPQLPLWLPGVHPYPRLRSPLDDIVYRYEQGEITAAEAAAEMGVNGGTSVYVNIEIAAPDNAEALAAWLRDNGTSLGLVIKDDRGGTNYITGSVPLSILGELSNRPGVLVVYVTVSTWPPGPQGAVLELPSKNPTPTPTPTPQGFAAHNVAPWHTAGYTGSGIKVGIIDTSFDGFSALQGSELPANPPASKKWLRCYTADSDWAPSANLADCAENDSQFSYHGTAVAQAVIDIAPGAELYLSNAAIGVNSPAGMYRLWKDVDWMISQGVDIINYSQGWNLAQGLGDGIPRKTSWFGNNRTAVDPLDTVKTAVDAGVIWVNAAGNQNQRIWHGAFSDGNNDNYHDFATGDDRNYITFGGTERKVIVDLRWDDSWGDADCNLDLYLFREGLRVPVKTSVNVQGVTSKLSYEGISYNNAPSGNYYLKVRKRRCDDPSDLSWFELAVYSPHTLEHAATGGSISYPADSKSSGMLAVGAAGWSNTSTIQPYSSRGPTTDGRIKPDLVGADCAKAGTLYPNELAPGTSTNSPGSRCWFWGTSQAAPHVAGLAALVLSRFPDYAPAEVVTYLKENADSRTQEPAPNNTDPNNVWGHGFAKLPAPALDARFTAKPTAIRVGQSLTFTLDLDNSQSNARVVVNNPGDTGKLHTVGSCPGTNVNTVSRENVVNDGASLAITGCSVGTSTIRIYHVGTGKLLNIYSVTVSDTASLSGLTISPGSLVETFTSSGTRYTAQVDNNISRITVTPTTTTPGATIRVGTSTVSSGSASGAVSLIAGRNNRITITVSAAGYTTRTYTITVTRAAAPLRPPTNLRLSTVSGQNRQLQLTYARSPETIHNYEFELHYLNKLTGKYVNYQQELDSKSPETFRSVGRGYWYKAQGRNCRDTSQEDTCGVWSDWSTEVEFSDPAIAISGLTGSYIAGDTDHFSVTLSDLTLDQPYTVTLASNQGSVIGFNFQCSYLPSKSFTPLDNSHTVYFTLHACQIPGTTVTAQSGTVTAKLWKGVASGSPLKIVNANATVTKASGSLSPDPGSITVGHDQTFTLTTNVPNRAGVWVTATVSGDTGRTTLPPTESCLYASSGHSAVNGNTITLRGCRAGRTKLTIYRSNSIIQLASYDVTVNASDTELSPRPSTITAGQDLTFTLSTGVPNNPGVWITATVPGNAGRTTLPPTRGCLYASSGIAAVNGNTITLRGCQEGATTLTIYRSNSSVLLASYTVNVAASNTSLSPTPAAFTIGTNQTFTLTTDIANTPGVWVGLNYNSADTGRLVLPNQDCSVSSAGTAAVNGSSITLKPCRAGMVTIKVNRSYSSVTLVSYPVTVNSP